MWQYTSKGVIDGLKGNFDLNKAYKNYPEITKSMQLKNEFKVRIKASGGLNIRKGPGTDYAIIGNLKNDSIVTVISTENGWGKLKDGGYISMNYTEKYEGLAPGEYTVTAEKGAAILKNPDINSDSIFTLPKGSKIYITNEKSGFAEIEICIKDTVDFKDTIKCLLVSLIILYI